MGLEDKELGDDLLAVHFFMEKDGSYTMFENRAHYQEVMRFHLLDMYRKVKLKFVLFLNSN